MSAEPPPSDRAPQGALRPPGEPVSELPSRYMGSWLLALCVATGLAAGIGGYTFRYAEGLSYLSKEPTACINCHIMNRQYDGWLKSSHHNVAVCIDCHLPHDFFAKYLAKAENGYRHSKEFTAQTTRGSSACSSAMPSPSTTATGAATRTCSKIKRPRSA